MLIGSIPCVLGFNVLSDFNIAGLGIMDIEDFIVSYVLLPLGSLVYLLFCVTKFGWGFDNYLEECNAGSGMRFKRWLKPYFLYVMPALILIIFVSGLVNL